MSNLYGNFERTISEDTNDDVFVCDDCGSTEVVKVAFVNPKTNELLPMSDDPYFHCLECECLVDITIYNAEEYKAMIADEEDDEDE